VGIRDLFPHFRAGGVAVEVSHTAARAQQPRQNGVILRLSMARRNRAKLQ
jgi:hypothetical protein